MAQNRDKKGQILPVSLKNFSANGALRGIAGFCGFSSPAGTPGGFRGAKARHGRADGREAAQHTGPGSLAEGTGRRKVRPDGQHRAEACPHKGGQAEESGAVSRCWKDRKLLSTGSGNDDTKAGKEISPPAGQRLTEFGFVEEESMIKHIAIVSLSSGTIGE